MALPRRAGRRTNVALLGLLAAAFGTGALVFGFGTPGPSSAAVVAHSAVGLAIVLLVPWKSVIARRGLRRPSGHGGGLVLAGLVALAVLSGLVHAFGGYQVLADITAMQLHLTAAILVVPVVLLHVLQHPQRPRRTDLSRRTALRTGLLGGSALVAYGTLEAASGVLGLPGADRRVTGSHERGSGDPDTMPVTQWLDDEVPVLGAGAAGSGGHRVHAVQLVGPGTVRALDLAGLAAAGDQVDAVLDCTGGWWAAQTWRGVRVDRLLDAESVPLSGARSLLVVSTTGYARRLPLADASRLLLATHVGGAPLSAGHGAPVRLVAPGRRGFWWVKWVRRVEVSSTPWWWQPPFPLT
ncbi:MAG: molybdopterin-dependent oxidoreductase [Actinomycetes bacterium]